MRRFLWGLVLLGLLITGVVQAAEIQLRFSWWGVPDRHEATLKAIKLYEETHPGIRIRGDYSAFAGYRDRLAKQLASKSEADIIQLDWAWLSEFSPDGLRFLDLNAYRAKLNFQDFSNGSYNAGLVFGKLNALPISYTARVFFWQKNTFEKAGIAIPKTWEALFAAGRTFRDRLGPQYYPLDGDPYDVILLAHAYIQQKTGKPYISPSLNRVALNHAELMEWLAVYKKLTTEHVVVPLAQRLALGGTQKPTEQQADWINGQWAGVYAWSSTLRSRTSTLPQSSRFEVGDFLSQPQMRNSGMLGRPTMLFAVSKNSQHPEEAVKFLDYLLTDPAANKILGSTRGYPLTRTAIQVANQTDALLPFELKAQEQIQKTRISPASPLFESKAILDLMLGIFENYALGKISQEEAANRLEQEANQLLALSK